MCSRGVRSLPSSERQTNIEVPKCYRARTLWPFVVLVLVTVVNPHQCSVHWLWSEQGICGLQRCNSLS